MVLGRRPAKEAIQKLFEIADEDGSGELDLREWTKVAKRGELVDKEILHPKYRLMMEIKRRRAGERDASEAALQSAETLDLAIPAMALKSDAPLTQDAALTIGVNSTNGRAVLGGAARADEVGGRSGAAGVGVANVTPGA